MQLCCNPAHRISKIIARFWPIALKCWHVDTMSYYILQREIALKALSQDYEELKASISRQIVSLLTSCYLKRSFYWSQMSKCDSIADRISQRPQGNCTLTTPARVAGSFQAQWTNLWTGTQHSTTLKQWAGSISAGDWEEERSPVFQQERSYAASEIPKIHNISQRVMWLTARALGIVAVSEARLPRHFAFYFQTVSAFCGNMRESKKAETFHFLLKQLRVLGSFLSHHY